MTAIEASAQGSREDRLPEAPDRATAVTTEDERRPDGDQGESDPASPPRGIVTQRVGRTTHRGEA